MCDLHSLLLTLTAMETIKGAVDSAKKAMLGEEVGGGWESGREFAAVQGNLGSIGLCQFECCPDSSGRSLWLHDAMAAAALPAALPVRLLRAAQTWHPLAQRTRLPR